MNIVLGYDRDRQIYIIHCLGVILTQKLYCIRTYSIVLVEFCARSQSVYLWYML